MFVGIVIAICVYSQCTYLLHSVSFRTRIAAHMVAMFLGTY